MSTLIYFEPIQIGNDYYGDSSDIWKVDVFTPIQTCIDKGFKKS